MIRLFAVVSVLVGAGAFAAPKQRVVILNLTASDKSLQALAQSTTELVSTELSRSPRFDTISQNDVATMLGVERQRQLLGCAKDGSSCLAELSSAFGAKWLVTGSLARFGKTVRFDLKLIDTDSGKTPFRDGRTFKNESELFDVATSMVRTLMTRDDLWGAPPAPEVVTKPAEKPSEKPSEVVVTSDQVTSPSPSLLPWVMVGVGGAAFVTGAVFSTLAAMDYATLTQPNYATTTVWHLVDATSTSYRRNVYLGPILLGVGAGLVAGGLLWKVLTGSTKAPPLSLVVTPSGLLVAGAL